MTAADLLPRILPGSFTAAVFNTHRKELNARFGQARQVRPGIDAAVFGGVLARLVAPLVESVGRLDSSRVENAGLALYDLALELVGRDLLGGLARSAWVEAGWSGLLPMLAPFLTLEPRLVAGSITNALYNLSQAPGARPREWLDRMAAAAPFCPDTSALLAAGQVLAWQAGLAHFRLSALQVAQSLPDHAARSALGLPEDAGLSTAAALARWQTDPWWLPARSDSTPGLRLAGRAGGFRGFGGPFLGLPQVGQAQGRFIVQADGLAWTLFADAFGTVLQRTAASSAAAGASARLKLSAGGQVSFGNTSKVFAELHNASSWAADERTLVASSPLSFKLTVVAWS